MAFRDLFRRADREAEFVDLPRPRPAHYELAHRALPAVGLSNPLLFLGAMASPEAEAHLHRLLGAVARRPRVEPTGVPFRAADLKLHRRRLGRFPTLIIELPRPRAMGEAYMVALVGLFETQDVTDDEEQVLTARYFTLEKGYKLDGTGRTVLCEWSHHWEHSNFGDGPPPIVDRFLEAVGHLVGSTSK